MANNQWWMMPAHPIQRAARPSYYSEEYSWGFEEWSCGLELFFTDVGAASSAHPLWGIRGGEVIIISSSDILQWDWNYVTVLYFSGAMHRKGAELLWYWVLLLLLLYACLEASWHWSNKSMLEEGSDLNPKNVIGAMSNDYLLHIPKN
jgi:hypothetical protein